MHFHLQLSQICTIICENCKKVVAKLNQFLLTAKNCWYRSLLDMAAAIGLLVELHF